MRKTLCILLTVVLTLSMVVPAFAATGDSAELERVITKVKAIVSVPDSLSEFEYSSWYYDDQDKESKVWNLDWNDEDQKIFISVMAGDDGTILHYNKYVDDRGSQGLGSVTKEQATKTAESFLNKVLPATYKNVKLLNSSSSNDGLYAQYQVYVNDIPVSFLDPTLRVDTYSGEVAGYSGECFLGSGDLKFPKTAGVIGQEKAEAAFAEKLGIKLCYKSTYDWEKKQLNIFPVYEDKSRGRYIDALTGEPVKQVYGRFYGGMGGGTEDAAAEKSSGRNLTPEEQKAVDNVKEMLSQTDAEKAIREKVPSIKSSDKVVDASLSYDRERDMYYWSVSFGEAFGSVDAKTGELISFYCYQDWIDGQKFAGIEKEKAMAAAEAFLKSVSPDKWGQVAFSEGDSILEYENYNQIYLVYSRQIGDLEYSGDYMAVSIGSDGKIYSYFSRWHGSAKFPTVEKPMGEDAAFDVFAKEKGYGLTYILGKAGKVQLVYGFGGQDTYYLDSATGEKLGYDGKPYRQDVTPEYSDISGKWYEATVKTLLDNGYYMDSATFSGGSQITQEGFLRYLYSPQQSWYDDSDDFYEMLLEIGIVKEGEKAPTQLLSRQDAAKFVVRYAGQGLAAAHPEIFKSSFKDKVQAEYVGYAAVAKALGILQGDAKGRFNGTNILTNAEAAVVIYNTLNVK